MKGCNFATAICSKREQLLFLPGLFRLTNVLRSNHNTWAVFLESNKTVYFSALESLAKVKSLFGFVFQEHM